MPSQANESRLRERLNRALDHGPAPDPARLRRIERDLPARRRPARGDWTRWVGGAVLVGAAATAGAAYWIADLYTDDAETAQEPQAAPTRAPSDHTPEGDRATETPPRERRAAEEGTEPETPAHERGDAEESAEPKAPPQGNDPVIYQR